MPLHLDYRPDKWKDFEGSSTMVKQLRSKIMSNDPPHSVLITGPSGCGKTTLARLIAISLGALDRRDDPAKAPNYREMDSADFRGIDTIREIRRTMRLAPVAGGDCRVYTLDECHQLTRDAQEALLKALEDTPNHVFFVLATTEPKKLKATLIRRCMPFNVQPLSDEEMAGFLNSIGKCEKTEIGDKLIRKITDRAQGSPGRALMMLDKVIDMDDADIDDLLDFEGETERQVIDLCRALIDKKPWTKAVAPILKKLKAQGEEPERVRLAVFGYCAAILSKSDNKRAWLIMDSFREPIFDGSGFGKIVLYSYESLYAE